MAGVFKDALKNATQDFNRHVKPILSALWKDCQIFSCEDQQDPLLRALDNYAGIDYLILRENQQRIIGLASRVQRGFNFQTFTIRAARESGTKTELEKRLNAITGGALFPTLTLQAYLSTDGEELLQMALVSTIDLFDFIQKFPSQSKHTGENQHGQASFIVVKWDDFKRKYTLMTIKPEVEPNCWLIEWQGSKKIIRS